MLFQANVIGEGIIDREKPVGSPPYVLGDGLLAMYGDREGVTIHLVAADAEDAERRIIARLGDVTIDDLQEAVWRPDEQAAWRPYDDRVTRQEEHHDLVSADVVLPLATGEALFIADSLELLAGLDEGEHTNYDELVRVAKYVREFAEKEVPA